MFKIKFQELFDEIFPADGLIGLQEGEEDITNNPSLAKEEYLTPFGWESFLKLKPRDWLYSCFQGQSNVYLIYLRIKDGKHMHFREKVKTTLSEKLDLKRTYYKIIECLTYMTLSHERNLQIVYNEGLLKINGKTRKSFFSDAISEEEEKKVDSE
ncbi:MAG: hypothetical protein JW928_02625 [Candidatus Aureabacteria bacterium]|nr:hypothetical protein [Candidatus Auribacterota bacterium]